MVKGVTTPTEASSQRETSGGPVSLVRVNLIRQAGSSQPVQTNKSIKMLG
jgi:hypothetical protein